MVVEEEFVLVVVVLGLVVRVLVVVDVVVVVVVGGDVNGPQTKLLHIPLMHISSLVHGASSLLLSKHRKPFSLP